MIWLFVRQTAVAPYEHVELGIRLLWAVPVGLVTTAIACGIARVVMRREVRALGFVYAAIYGPVVGFLAVSHVNVHFDRSRGTSHTVEVLRYEHRHKGSNQIVVRSWRNADDTVSLDAWLGESQVPSGTTVEIVVHPGWLGATWVQPQP